MRPTGRGILVIALNLAISTTVWAEVDLSRLPRELRREPAGTSADVALLEPWVGKNVPPRAHRSLTSAFALAVERLRNRSECQRLFDELGADGLEVLARSLYYGVPLPRERTICRQTSAFTNVGGRVTRLCRSFSRLRDDQAAVVLIHEALHQAGLTEKPMDPQALDSAQINELVTDHCAL
jgi:hypothetical protein